MTEVRGKPTRSRRYDCCVEPWKKCVLVLQLAASIKCVEANATIQNVIYVGRSTSSSSPF